ncbi:3-oxo-tetronate kinase [Devosia sp. A449]
MLLGAIADDFTGATDLASTLANEGMPVVQAIGIPDAALSAEIADTAAVVIALKSRTASTETAIAQSLTALAWLQSAGARQILFKYCSTFDSTPKGNIGPVADALAEAIGVELAVVCPAFPANGRSIYQGHLFVGDQLLQDSPMKDHPLTPMRQSNLVALMAEQSRRAVGLVGHGTVAQGSEAIRAALAELQRAGSGYAVTDAITDDDLRQLGIALADHRLITGGSAIAMGLPNNFRQQGLLPASSTADQITGAGRAVVFAGSCSAATRAQLERARQHWPSLQLDADAIAANQPVVADVLAWAAAQPEAMPLIIYSSADPDEVLATQQRYGRERAGTMMENTIGQIAVGMRAQGAQRILVAGGETSGAVVSALGIKALRIGQQIAPGVPWTQSLGAQPVALALKSGNFGGAEFFAKALDLLR